MMNRNQPTKSAAPAIPYLNVFTVEEFESNRKKAKCWTRIVMRIDTSIAGERRGNGG